LNGLWRPSRIGGEYILHPGKPNECRVKNTVTGDGAALFLRNLFRAEAVMPATFYLGLTNASYTYSSALLVDIAAGEPTVGGYGRQPILRDIPSWVISQISDTTRCRSIPVTFTATAQWDKQWTRMFLCDAASGTVGTVFSLSKALDPQTVLAGQGPSMAYEHWIRP